MLLAASLEEWNVHQRLALGMVAKIGTRTSMVKAGFIVDLVGATVIALVCYFWVPLVLGY
jgi:di/tricarboxylate transporter